MGYTKLFWGFFFILIGFNINGFDIFPNIIGYILVFIALGELAERLPNVKKLKKLLIPLMIIWCIETGLIFLGQDIYDTYSWSLIISFIFSLALTLYCLYVYKLIFNEVAVDAMNSSKADLSLSLKNNFNIYGILSIISCCFLLLTIVLPLLFILLLPLAIAIIVFAIRLLINLNEIKNEMI